MMFKVKLRKLHNRVALGMFSRSNVRYKLKYLLQTNELYLTDEIKQIKNIEGLDQRLNKIQLSVEVKYKASKNDHGDTILTVYFIKTGSMLDDKIHELGSQLQSLFNATLLEKNNSIKHVEYVLLYKENSEQEICDLSKNVQFNPQGFISLSKREKWDYISKPHLLLGGNSGTGKSYLLFSIIHEILREAPTYSIYICDGKFDELEEVATDYFNLPMVASDVKNIKMYIETVEELMEQRYANKSKNNEAIFLIIDEFAALSLVIDKKEWQSLNTKIKNIILKGRAANVHVLIAMQRASADSIDLAIRDNTAVKIGLGNLSVENFRMIFGEGRGTNDILQRERGQGYILIDGQSLSLFDSPFIKM